MNLDNEDRIYLDKHFDKITDVQVEIAGLRTAFNSHVDNPCKNIAKHGKEHKGFVSFMITLVLVILALLTYLFK